MGENGAGKSTLMKILTGVYTKDAGTILVDGQEVSYKNPQEAEKAGIVFIYQELNVLFDLTVEENLFMGKEITKKFGICDKKAMRAKAREVMEKMGVDIPLYGMVKDDFHKTRAIVTEDREISIAHEMGVYSLIYRIQEEAHRFAVKHTMGKKRRSLTSSSLEKIDGIGPKKAKILLKAMTLKELKAADVEKIAAVKGISRKDSERIYEYFHKDGE
jgi:ABC-type sugar transport system ATPase subunit